MLRILENVAAVNAKLIYVFKYSLCIIYSKYSKRMKNIQIVPMLCCFKRFH